VNNTNQAVEFNVSPSGSYWIPFVLEPGRDARITNGSFINIITGRLRTGNRVEATEKVENGRRYEIAFDLRCKCRTVRPL
jgi:hypothetical protein